MMKKKVKKIPKYNAGGSVLDTLLKNNPLSGNPMGSTNNNSTNNFSKFSDWKGTSANPWKDMTSTQKTGAVIDAVGAIGQGLGVATSGQDVNVGTALSTAAGMAGAGMTIGGPIGAAIGAGVGAIMGTAGRKVGYDADSSSTNFDDIYDPGSGWLSWFGHKGDAKRKANLVLNSNISKIQSENIKEMYYSNPNVTFQPITAAEGGIMRLPVDALVSPGEIAINPYTLEYRQFGSDNEEPNSKDNIKTVLETGDNVKSHAKHMIMPNGKTPADNSKMVLDSNMPEEMKRKMIKKIDNWESAHRTKPQEYAKFDEGYSGFFKYLMDNRTRPLVAVMSEWFRQRGKVAPKFDGFGKLDFLNGIKNIYNTQSDYEAPIKLIDDFNWNQHRNVPIDQLFEFNPNALTTKVEKPKNTSTKSTAKVNYSPQNVGIHTHSEIDPVLSRHKTGDYVITETTPSVSTTNTVKKDSRVVSKKGTANKPVSDNNTTSNVPLETKLTPEQIAEFLSIEDIGERHWLRGSVTEPKQSFASLAKITPEKIKLQGVNNVAPLTDIKSLTDTTETDNTGYTGSNWKDNLYRMAVLSQPLWDRAKAEPVNYESPVYKYMPIQIDVTSQFRDADQSHALAKYNFANLYPNTGAGMAAGLQAAANRAKQYADIRQYQTNAQNELIGKNVGIYNNWANEHARIMNDVYNKTAANRAAARNINRQNRAAALSNYGQMLRDDKQYSMDTLKINMLEPLLAYGTENSDTIVKKARKTLNG